MLSRFSCLLVTIVPLAAALTASPVRAQYGHDELQYSIEQLAAASKEVMRLRDVKTIAVGPFTGPPSLASAAGAGIKLRLEQELRRIDVERRTIGAPLSVSGSFRIGEEAYGGGKAKVIVIEARYLDGEGNLLVELNQPIKVQRVVGEGDNVFTINGNVPVNHGVVSLTVHGAGAIATLIGSSTAETKRPRDQPWNAKITPDAAIKSLTKPTAVLLNDGTAVAASQSSPFQMSILVDGKLRRMTLVDGHPFVELEMGETFKVLVKNNARFTAACTLLLDGVNNFAFSEVLATEGDREGLHKYQRWILDPHILYRISGWHINNKEVHEFQIGDFVDSANAKVGGAAGVGTISALFQATWIMGREAPPHDEPVAAAGGPAIIRGDRRSQRVQEDLSHRYYGRERAVITVRYLKPALIAQ